MRAPWCKHEEVREFDTLRRRSRQLLPLLTLYLKEIVAEPSHFRARKKSGYTGDVLNYLFPFFSFLDVLLLELKIPGVLERWSFHAFLKEQAQNYSDGRVYRSSPHFTFNHIVSKGQRIRLGTNMYLHQPSEARQVCRLNSIFMHEKSSSIGCYVQLYSQGDKAHQLVIKRRGFIN